MQIAAILLIFKNFQQQQQQQHTVEANGSHEKIPHSLYEKLRNNFYFILCFFLNSKYAR